MAPNVDNRYTTNPFSESDKSKRGISEETNSEEKMSPLFEYYEDQTKKTEAKIAQRRAEIKQIELVRQTIWNQKCQYCNILNNLRREYGSNMNDEQKDQYNDAYKGYWSSCSAYTRKGNGIDSAYSSIRMYNEDLTFNSRMQQGEELIQCIKNQTPSQFGV